MIAQIRIYPILAGRMDEWLALFNEKLAPTHAKVGIKILGAWANRETNDFIWIRAYENEADMAAKDQAYTAHPDRKVLGTLPQSLHGEIDVRTVEDVFKPSTVAR
jgi:hypothetical protein